MKKSEIVEIACQDFCGGPDGWVRLTTAERDEARLRMGWVVDKIAEMLRAKG